MAMTGELLLIPIADIEIGERIAVRDDAHIAHLAGLFEADGQRDPIEVAKRGPDAARPWLLVAGYHRIHAAMAAGLPHIAAYQVADENATVAQLKLIELSENVDHRKHRPIDLSILIAARAEIELAVDYPDAANEPWYMRAAKTRWAKDDAQIIMTSASENGSGDAEEMISSASNWLVRTAIAFSRTDRSIRHYLTIYRNLAVVFPDHISALNFHPALEGFTSAYRLAQIKDEGSRRAVVEALIAKPEIETLDQAMVEAKISTSKGQRPAKGDLAPVKFQTGWEAMRLPEKRAWALKFAGWVTDGMALEMVRYWEAHGHLRRASQSAQNEVEAV